MKWLFALLCFSTAALAQTSVTIPAFLKAAVIYTESPLAGNNLVTEPKVRAILQVLQKNKIDPVILEKYLPLATRKSEWLLPADDEFDRWTQEARLNPNQHISDEVPEIALHAVKFDVIEESDDFFNDDIYTYFFITDGVIPTGKISDIYKGLDQGQSFFFNQVDRAIFPLAGIAAKRPNSHLIVDYGIIESDGDDIKELQKISSIIIDMAIAVYASIDPQSAQIIINLRKEIKALAELLINLNHDDRLATGSFGFKNKEITRMLSEESYVEFKKKHKKNSRFDSWEYDIHFRMLRN
jgi:hypothetical protein